MTKEILVLFLVASLLSHTHTCIFYTQSFGFFNELDIEPFKSDAMRATMNLLSKCVRVKTRNKLERIDTWITKGVLHFRNFILPCWVKSRELLHLQSELCLNKAPWAATGCIQLILASNAVGGDSRDGNSGFLGFLFSWNPIFREYFDTTTCKKRQFLKVGFF